MFNTIFQHKLHYLGSDAGGHPSIAVRKCSATVGDINLAFNGGWSFIYNMLKSKIEEEMKSTLKEMVGISSNLQSIILQL